MLRSITFGLIAAAFLSLAAVMAAGAGVTMATGATASALATLHRG